MITLSQLPDSFKLPNNHLRCLKVAMRDEKPLLCENCNMHVKKVDYKREHLPKCFKMSLSMRKNFPCLIGNGGFICHLGCRRAIYKTSVGLYEHFWRDHTHEELAHWYINPNLLEKEFGLKERKFGYVNRETSRLEQTNDCYSVRLKRNKRYDKSKEIIYYRLSESEDDQ